MKSHYELLDLGPNASADEIKKAFRREIARYHPDKVQHLGPEFQEIASVRAAELTEAYRVLIDDDLRARYDERLTSGALPGPQSRASTPPSGAATPPRAWPGERPAEPASSPAAAAQTRPAGPSDFVRKVGASRLRDAVTAVIGSPAAISVPGFDAAYEIKGKGGLFKKSEPPVRLLVKFVALVDTEAIAASWLDAVRAAKGEDYLCVLLLLGAAGMATSKELSAAIAARRRKTRGTAPVIVPVDVRDWEALFPPDTPSAVRGVMQWLKQGAV